MFAKGLAGWKARREGWRRRAHRGGRLGNPGAASRWAGRAGPGRSRAEWGGVCGGLAPRDRRPGAPGDLRGRGGGGGPWRRPRPGAVASALSSSPSFCSCVRGAPGHPAGAPPRRPLGGWAASECGRGWRSGRRAVEPPRVASSRRGRRGCVLTEGTPVGTTVAAGGGGGLRRRWFLLAEADAWCGGTGGGLDVGCKSARGVGGLPSDYLF